MDLKIISWNIRKAGLKSDAAWSYLLEFNADIILLQEVNSFPKYIKEIYSISYRKAITKTGNKQQFGTAILVKGEIINEIELVSQHEWVNKELAFFHGNLIACTVKIQNHPIMNLISVYSPAWPVNPERIKGVNVKGVKLNNNRDVWCTEILWSALKKTMPLNNNPWIVGGDFNSSVTFDYLWGDEPRGNQEIIDRLYALGFKECLKEFNQQLVPTFKNAKGGKVIHQMDHLYVTHDLYKNLTFCKTGKNEKVFGENLSDHLPIVLKISN